MFFLRVHAIPIDQAGLLLGGIAAAGGFLGVAIGGFAADAWRRRDPRGRLYFALASTLVPVPLLIGLVITESTSLALALNFPLAMASSMWIGVGASTVQDLVLPRMRATASAAYLLVVTFIGLAMGPYTIGKFSDLFDLRTALLLGLCANGIAVRLHRDRVATSRARRGEPARARGRRGTRGA